MDLIAHAINIVINLSQFLEPITKDFGWLSYIIPFIIILCETGLVVTPFLPGDSLAFTFGALAATGSLHIEILFPALLVAAILGDNLNYKIGAHLGPKVIKRKHRFLKQEHLLKAQKFFAKHGSQAIILARFIPIVRTMVPFVAGIGAMNYRSFICNNIVGAFIWAATFVLGGYYFGNMSLVQNNFSLLLVLIILVSILPIFIPYLRKLRLPAAHSA